MGVERVVFVLGAGASAPYGFPIGRALRDDICDNFASRCERMVEPCRSAEPYRGVAERLTGRLRASRSYSIDFFLAHQVNSDLREAGRIAIAMSLLRMETEETLDRPVDPEDDWYRALANAIPNSFVPAGILTYNYDRSLEHYLYEALRVRHSDGVARDFLLGGGPEDSELITHLHGSFGRLPWKVDDDTHDPPVAYGDVEEMPDDFYRQTIAHAAKRIGMVYDNPHPRTMRKVYMVLGQADRLVFLGFGYDEKNLARLRLGQNLKDGVPIVGTGFRLSEGGRRRAQELLMRLSRQSGRSHTVEVTRHKSLALLQESSWFE